jgi:hypothetical protein
VASLRRAIQAHALNRRMRDRQSRLERRASELERTVETLGRGGRLTPMSGEP